MKKKIKDISDKMKERICFSTPCHECCLRVNGVCMRDWLNQKTHKEYNDIEVEVNEYENNN